MKRRPTIRSGGGEGRTFSAAIRRPRANSSGRTRVSRSKHPRSPARLHEMFGIEVSVAADLCSDSTVAAVTMRVTERIAECAKPAVRAQPMVALPRPGDRIWRPLFSYDTVAAGYVGRVGTWPPLPPGTRRSPRHPVHRRTSWTERPAPAANLRLRPGSARRGLEHHPDLGHLVVRPLERRGHGCVGYVRGRGDAIGAIGCVKAGDLAEDVVHVAAPA